MKFYDTIIKIFAKAVRWFFRIHVYGAENEPFPADTGMIICANHISDSDVVIMIASLKNRIRFFAKAEIFKVPVLKQFVEGMGAYPVERKSFDVGSIKKTISLLKEGEVIGFYPQGKRYVGVDPAKTEYKNGIGMIEYRAKAKVLPVYIQTKNNRIKPFRRVNLFVGIPIEYEDFNFTEGSQAEYSTASKLVFDKILELNRTVE